MLQLIDVYDHYLDELRFLAQRARRCPLGRSDPDSQEAEWSYALAPDLGSPVSTVVKAQAVQWHRVLTVWTRNYPGTEWAWHVLWDAVTGWHDYWTVRTPETGGWMPCSDDLWLVWAWQGMTRWAASL